MLRHTFGTTLLANGENLRTIRALMNHRNIATASRYLHSHNTELANAVNRISLESGRACIRGIRISVSVIVGQIAHGASFEEILEDYPDLEREDIKHAIEYATCLTQEEVHTIYRKRVRFLADMGISARVVQWLGDKGHDATHLAEQGLQGSLNGETFDKGIASDGPRRCAFAIPSSRSCFILSSIARHSDSVLALVGTHIFFPRCRNRVYQTARPLAFLLFQGMAEFNHDIRVPSWLADVLHGIRRQSYRYEYPAATRSIR